MEIACIIFSSFCSSRKSIWTMRKPNQVQYFLHAWKQVKVDLKRNFQYAKGWLTKKNNKKFTRAFQDSEVYMPHIIKYNKFHLCGSAKKNPEKATRRDYKWSTLFQLLKLSEESFALWNIILKDESSYRIITMLKELALYNIRFLGRISCGTLSTEVCYHFEKPV